MFELCELDAKITFSEKIHSTLPHIFFTLISPFPTFSLGELSFKHHERKPILRESQRLPFLTIFSENCSCLAVILMYWLQCFESLAKTKGLVEQIRNANFWLPEMISKLIPRRCQLSIIGHATQTIIVSLSRVTSLWWYLSLLWPTKVLIPRTGLLKPWKLLMH